MITVYSVTDFAEFSESGDIAKKNRSSWVINMSGRVGNQATVYPNYLATLLEAQNAGECRRNVGNNQCSMHIFSSK